MEYKKGDKFIIEVKQKITGCDNPQYAIENSNLTISERSLDTLERYSDDEYRCPWCLRKLDEYATVYMDDAGTVVGCEYCLKAKEANEVLVKRHGKERKNG